MRFLVVMAALACGSAFAQSVKVGELNSYKVFPAFLEPYKKGWELAVEAMIPTTKATGRGFGVIAQFVLQLDYLLPNSVFGRPIFSPH